MDTGVVMMSDDDDENGDEEDGSGFGDDVDGDVVHFMKQRQLWWGW